MVNHLALSSFRTMAILIQLLLAFAVQLTPIGVCALDLKRTATLFVVSQDPMSARSVMPRNVRVLMALPSGTIFPCALATFRACDMDTLPRKIYELSVALNDIFGSSVVMIFCAIIHAAGMFQYCPVKSLRRPFPSSG